ncbi:MAG: response regulator transcription factor [Lachnospiraceae bacterium]|nr:response regulator transcription factor [Lachnospiraceae bacterium]
MSTILIIEDDKKINSLLNRILNKSGFETVCADNGFDGLSLALNNDYSLILMDLMLPLRTGEEVLHELRKSKNTPVIVLSAKNQVYNRIELLRLGADDYITKPFDIDEVILRINAVLRRSEFQIGKKISFRNITLNTESKRVFVSDKEIICTAMEYSILELLIKNPDKIFSKRNLFESITGEDYVSDENTMNVHISNLRKKIRQADDSEYIETVYGMGYRLIN